MIGTSGSLTSLIRTIFGDRRIKSPNPALDIRKFTNTFTALQNMKIALLTGLTLATCLAIEAAAPGFGAPPASTNTFKTNAPLSNPEAASVIKNDVDKLSYSFRLNM